LNAIERLEARIEEMLSNKKGSSFSFSLFGNKRMLEHTQKTLEHVVRELEEKHKENEDLH